MKEGDKVRPRRFPNGHTGVVRLVEGKDVAVQWVMGSGWKHTAWYELDELEVER